MADLGNRTNVNTAINLLLDDAQPNEAIQPSDHNTLLQNILDTLANGLSVTLRTNPETGGQDIEITSGDKLKYKSSTFFNSLVSATLTADRTLTFPDKTDTIATLTDIKNIMNTNGLILGGNYTHDLNSNNLVFDDGTFRLTNGSLGVLGSFNATHDGATGQDVATFISSSANTIMVLSNTKEAVAIGTTGPSISAILDIESTSKAVLFPRMTTTQRNAISTPLESMFIYNTTTDQFEFRSSGGTWDAFGGGGGGVFGITDASGIYTYYTTIELALAGASSGDTIEQFANVSVSTSTSITLDKDITWNMNGYEYKNTSTSSFIMLNLPNNTTIDLTINNGQFVRNTGSSNGGILFYMGNQILTKINSNGVIYDNIEGQSVDGKADITGGTFKSGLTSGNGFYFQGIAHNIKVYSNRLNQLLNPTCRIYSSYFYSSVNYTILTGGAICYNTIFESPASYGVRLGTGTTTELNNCVAKGLFAAIFMQGSSIYNCTGISTGGFGIEMANASARAFNCVGISPATNGFSINGLAEAYNCTALATSGYAVTMQNDGKFKNGTAKTTYNNANGHGVYITGAPVSGGFEIVGCEIITTNASANAIDGIASAQGKYAQNSYKGMTTAIGLVTSNLATNTTDAQGNLLL